MRSDTDDLDRYRLMTARDDARDDVVRLRELLREAEARYKKLAQEAYEAGDRGR
jgi:hypothetical protein